jgi:epoxyqueuosine reductase
MERLLLHHCCAPCSAGTVPSFKKDYRVEGFWFNPNIHPAGEHANRLESLARFAGENSITLHYGETFSEHDWVAGAPADREARCGYCYKMRLGRTAEAAKKLGIMKFSTTLLSSPFQKHELVRAIGEEAAAANGLEFIHRDLRPGYFDGKNDAKKNGYYIQKYCGCRFSMEERKAKKGK